MILCSQWLVSGALQHNFIFILKIALPFTAKRQLSIIVAMLNYGYVMCSQGDTYAARTEVFSFTQGGKNKSKVSSGTSLEAQVPNS